MFETVLSAERNVSIAIDGDKLCTARTSRVGLAAANVEPTGTGEFNIIIEVAMKIPEIGNGYWAHHLTFAGSDDPIIRTFEPSSALIYRFRRIYGSVDCRVRLA